MNRITELSDFRIGRIMYHVYGINRRQTRVEENQVEKYIVLSKPYKSKHSDILMVDVEYNYVTLEGESRSFKTHICPGDNAIFDTDRTVFNLNRLFADKESAMQYLQELKDDKFSCPRDQEYADRWTPEALEERRAIDYMWHDYEDDCDDADWDALDPQ